MKLGRQFDRLQQILGVAAGLRHMLPPLAGKVLDAIDVGVETLAGLAPALVSARARARELGGVKRNVREALRQDLDAIRRTAQAVAIRQPGMDPGQFRFPGNGDKRLLTSARAIASNVAPLVDTFVEHAMPHDFLETLETRIQEFDQTLAQCAAADRTVTDLKRQIKAKMRNAQTDAKALDPMVRNVLGEDELGRAAWDEACLGRRRRRRKAQREQQEAQAQDAPTPEPQTGAGKKPEPSPEPDTTSDPEPDAAPAPEPGVVEAGS